MEEANRLFGCDSCWPESAEAAWKGFRAMANELRLVDESHYIVSIRSCRNCEQRFLSMFTETVDWADGEDPQYRTILPLTEEETADLSQPDTKLVLQELGPDRRSLFRDFPKGADPLVWWGTGMRITPRD